MYSSKSEAYICKLNIYSIFFINIFRTAETEVTEFHEQISDLSMQNQALTGQRRKLEQEADNLKQDSDDMRGILQGGAGGPQPCISIS